MTGKVHEPYFHQPFGKRLWHSPGKLEEGARNVPGDGNELLSLTDANRTGEAVRLASKINELPSDMVNHTGPGLSQDIIEEN